MTGRYTGRQDRRVRLGKRYPQSAALHQPGFIAVPEGRDRVHDQVALRFLWIERKKNANAEIEAIEHHIHRDRKADDQRPHDGQGVADAA
jgi:hypothetical protein